MIEVKPAKHIGGLIKPIPLSRHRFSKIITLLIVLLFWTSGCSGTSPHRLLTHFEHEPDASGVIQEKLSAHSYNRLPVGLALVLEEDYSHVPLTALEDSWPQFTARTKHAVQDLIPVSMQEVLHLNEIPAGEKSHLLKDLGMSTNTEMVLVVLPSSKEVKGPAKFDLLPEVSMLNGHQTENHATVELCLLDLKSGKLLIQSQGTSYATLEQLDVPLASNRYPRVRGSSMTKPIYPEEGKALETLRMVALNEAFDQAVLKLAGKWPHGQKG